MQKHFKEVLDSCTNYDLIVNYNIPNNDKLSQILIKFYQDYVFFNWSSKDNIKLLDKILFTYIVDNDFNDYIHNEYENADEFLPIFDILLKQYNKYQNEQMKLHDCTNWI